MRELKIHDIECSRGALMRVIYDNNVAHRFGRKYNYYVEIYAGTHTILFNYKNIGELESFPELILDYIQVLKNKQRMYDITCENAKVEFAINDSSITISIHLNEETTNKIIISRKKLNSVAIETPDYLMILE